ncbi:hypothetical protein [Streptosporangium sp. NPDC051022]|uniref:hypothetical protein n=1 Tax=Streptosporangium sp. NPDC051022 TaxID=3155752 RepID=UPI00342D0463
MRAVITLGMVALIVLGCVAIALIYKRAEQAREDRRERRRHEEFLDRIHKSAIGARDVEPYAAVLADEIRNHFNPLTLGKRTR